MNTPTPVQTRPDTDERLEALARVARIQVWTHKSEVVGIDVMTAAVSGHLGDQRHWRAHRTTSTDPALELPPLLCFLDDKPISWVDLIEAVAADRAGDPIDDLRYSTASDF